MSSSLVCRVTPWARSRAAAEAAELAIVLIDGTVGITEEDREVMELASRCEHWIFALSKADLLEGNIPVIAHSQLPAKLPDAFASVSTVTRDGLAALEDAIKELYPLGTEDRGTLLTNPRQAEAVTRALHAIGRANTAYRAGFTPDAILTDTEDAISALGELSGKTLREDLVHAIFSRFCVGK